MTQRLSEVRGPAASLEQTRRLTLRLPETTLGQLEAVAVALDLPPATLAGRLLREALEDALAQVKGIRTEPTPAPVEAARPASPLEEAGRL